MRVLIVALGLLLVATLIATGRKQQASGYGQTDPESAELLVAANHQPVDREVQTSAKKPESAKQEHADEPLLLMDDEPLLLLDDDHADGPSAKPRKMADNSRCHVCHLNYADEPLAVIHARAAIGCTACHGDCDEHIADESWASGGNGTAPGKMYRRQEVDAGCQKCHKTHDVPARDVIARWQQRDDQRPKQLAPGDANCTDCHGQHRLKERMCKWK